MEVDLPRLLAPLPLGLHACHVEAGGRFLVVRLDRERLPEGFARLRGLVLGLKCQRETEMALGKVRRESRALEGVLARLSIPATSAAWRRRTSAPRAVTRERRVGRRVHTGQV